MRKLILVLMVVSMLGFICIGCRHGDFKAVMVIAGQPVPFDGVTLSPEQWTPAGEPAKFTGIHTWFKGLDDALEPSGGP